MAKTQTSSEPIYLDYNGTTPIDPEVREVMIDMMSKTFGNPSSSHYYGLQARQAVEHARRQVAELIGAQPAEIIFMSNGTETINHALWGLVQIGASTGQNHVITQATEHVAVLEVCKALTKAGYFVTHVPVNEEGVVSEKEVEAAITSCTVAVSVMHSNNETGTLQPIESIVKAVRRKESAQQRIYVHCDASQSAGKVPLNVDDLGVDLMTLAGHKLYAPKGVGALYVRTRVPALPMFISGAGQEGGRRASTENVVHVAAMGRACEIARRDLAQGEAHMRLMRDRFEAGLRASLGQLGRADSMRINGSLRLRLPNTSSVSFLSVEANTLLDEISDRVAASAGAACHSDTVEISHVLLAMRVPQDWAMGTCRFTVGRGTTGEDVDRAARCIAGAAARLMPLQQGPLGGLSALEGQAMSADEVKLTRYTHGMGCACKLRPQVLEKVLEQVRSVAAPLGDPNVLCGLGRSNEDACVYRVSSELAMVATVDFFTPVVDDPADFGGIAAANALSDVYAMGARPIFALNVVGFPSGRLPLEVLARILQGGQAKCQEAQIPILGGHTVEDIEPKYGLCVLGLVNPDKMWRNNTLRAGDRLLLTKPIGSGILSTAMKRGLLAEAEKKVFTDCLLMLNRAAAECAQAVDAVHAATDVTGFGLLGHLLEMLTPSEEVEAAGHLPLAAYIDASAVPLLPRARELALNEHCVPGGSLSNLEAAGASGVAFDDEVPRELRLLLADAQSSGGLLLAIPAGKSVDLMENLRAAGMPESADIGFVRERAGSGAAVPLVRVGLTAHVPE